MMKSVLRTSSFSFYALHIKNFLRSFADEPANNLTNKNAMIKQSTKRPLIAACLLMLLTACTHRGVEQGRPWLETHKRVWSDRPAFTRLFDNQNDYGLTSDVYDGVWEGDAVPVLPRVPHPSAEVKRWHSGEGVDWLDEETSASTLGLYPNAQRLWEAEPYPIGNGRIGASVFHGSGRDRYALTDVTYWSGGRNGGTINAKGDKSFNGESGPEIDDDGFGGHQPVGDLIVDFDAPAQRGTFRRCLFLDEGLVGAQAVRRGVKVESRALCSHPDQVIALQYSADKPHGLSFGLSYAVQRPEDAVKADSSLLVLTSHLANGMSLVAQATVEAYGGRVVTHEGALRIEEADSCFIRVAVETNYVMDYSRGWRGTPAEERINAREEQLRNVPFSTLLARHKADYTQLFERQFFSLAAAQTDSLAQLPTYARLEGYQNTQNDLGLEETLFNFGRYLMIATSRGDAPPGGLQGIWNGMVRAPWGNDYHSNINLQMVYWLPEVGNLSEAHESLLNYLYATREPNRLATKEYMDAVNGADSSATNTADTPEGWIVYTSHNPFGGHGWQVNLPGSAWYALHMWEHFSFGQDTLYLRQKTYPMMREISRYWSAHLKTLGEGAEGFCSNYAPVDVKQCPELARVHAGTLVVPGGWSPEHGPRGEDGVAHDQQIVRELFLNTIKAADVLGVDREWADTLRALCSHLYGPQIGAKGNLMEWMIDRDPETVHRHTSHLFAVYPGSTISVASTPELAEAARQSLLFRKNEGESRTSWAWTWRSMLWARLHDGARSHQMMEGLVTYNMLPNLLTSHKIPQQIDGSYGIAAVMIEMLVQSHDDGTIELLPALPPQWRSGGSIKGVKARGGVTVDLTWRDGSVTDYRLTSPVPRRVRLLVNGEEKNILTE